jgi:DNA (cytosine-5)-methyltransferase 1
MNSPSSFTVVSTFSGCGGSSLGYQLAGGKVLLAVEWDNNAVATYRLNFPDTPIYHGDIGKLSVEACCEKAGVQPGELDILDGSPPCQGFSTAGKRDFGDDRNQLFREYVRLLRGLRPKVFVMENVSGMVKGRMKLIFVECLRELKASGYKVKEDLGAEPGHPKAQSQPQTVRQAWHGMEQLRGPFPKQGTKLAECCLGMKQGQNASQFYRKPWGFNLYRLEWNRPAPTFTKRGGCCGLIHPDQPRKCISKEYQAVMSYPHTFVFSGSEEDARERIGNSVPPNFMRAIAEYIRDNILSPVRAT